MTDIAFTHCYMYSCGHLIEVWLTLQEVMQRGAEEIGKMLNKKFDRQRNSTADGELPIMRANNPDEGFKAEVGVYESLHNTALKGQQVSAVGGEDARPWMKDVDPDAQGEMS